MRLKCEFETMELNGQKIAVPVGNNADVFHGVLRMNDTAFAIFQQLKEETTAEAILNTMEAEYEVDEEVLTEDIKRYINEFRARGLLVE